LRGTNPGGTTFFYSLAGSTRLICSIKVYSGISQFASETVNGIQVTQCDGSTSPVYGLSDGTATTFTTTVNDPIVYVNGRSGGGIDAIQFTTLSNNQSPLIGGTGGAYFSTYLGKGLVALSGYAIPNDQLYSVYFIYRCENCLSGFYGNNIAGPGTDGFDSSVDGLAGPICSITVYSAQYVAGIQLTSCSGTVSPLYGSTASLSGQTFTTVETDPIVQVYISNGGLVTGVIDALRFETLAGVSSSRYGGNGGGPSLVQLGPGGLQGMVGYVNTLGNGWVIGLQFSYICGTPNITYSGAYTFYTYTYGDTALQFPSDKSVEVLIVAGGGGGGYGFGIFEGAGAGGAGGVGFGSINLEANTVYTVSVGAGGPAGSVIGAQILSGNGAQSSITSPDLSLNEVAFGGGLGGSCIDTGGAGGGGQAGGNGGSGGGGCARDANTGYGVATRGSGTLLQYKGSDGQPGALNGGGGSGGGAEEVGSSGSEAGGGNGGLGYTWFYDLKRYGGGGGGGGGGSGKGDTPGGSGGSGGGGDGGDSTRFAVEGTANTGACLDHSIFFVVRIGVREY